MQKDINISDKANSVFEKFNSELVNKEKNNKKDVEYMNKNNYSRINKILSVATVSLTVVLVGGSTLYFSKDKGIINNSGDNNEVIVEVSQKPLVKNETLYVSNEKVVKEIENPFVISERMRGQIVEYIVVKCNSKDIKSNNYGWILFGE